MCLCTRYSIILCQQTLIPYARSFKRQLPLNKNHNANCIKILLYTALPQQ
uniref:Uncharacterized protein n=1 Tax=Glossina morsitans morsitans TaxID=37546 RepID=A0ABK9NFV6_GLOMM